jgi:DNA repair ATPase RecN
MKVQNLNWDSNSSRQDIEKATQKISATVEKGVGKITAAVKDNTAKVTDAIGKVKATTNETAQYPTVTLAVQRGLESIAKSTGKMAKHLRCHPGDLYEVSDSMEAVSKQLSDLSNSTTRCVSEGKEVRETVTSAVQACDWLDEKYCDGCDPGTEGNVADNERAAAQKFEKPQRFDFGLPAIPGVLNGATAPMLSVSSFNELPGAR